MHIYNKSCFKKYIFALFMLGITQFATAQMTQNYRSPNFWDNVRFGGGLGLGFGNDFFSGSITPSAIYQVNDKFATGVGLNFTYTDDRNYTATVFGGSVLGFYSPIREIQLSAEFEELHVNRKYEYDGIPDFRDEYWYPALHLGAGYNTGPVTIGVRYDVLYDDDKSIYGTPFMPFVRVYF
ncbi:hypothetical protein JoomaDRAFT_1531 [Galbibacter orientalis DSM 19592]|uniref:Alpha-ketoglutarate decarboxylase n=2 Tax=Galbibacter TaxID=379068 RepID=I3C4K3_9FLAO|nr:hypothetical protein [Galbibacter orientalis]EIJ38546.1 hypothetical protein JoomaDRAFT_1531 [Galbibacter orientalis DSM 19592]